MSRCSKSSLLVGKLAIDRDFGGAFHRGNLASPLTALLESRYVRVHDNQVRIVLSVPVAITID